MAVDELRRNTLRFITGIRYHKDMLERLNNLTYIYDNNWNPNNTNKATFPVCFFHIKSNGYHEVMNAEVSQKQMLFYNSAVANKDSDPSLSSDPAKDSGLLNVVADNIVIKPKTYKLDVIIPYHNLTLLDQSFVYNTHTNEAVIEALLNAKSEKATQLINAWGTLSTPYLNFLKTLLRSLVTANYNLSETNVQDWVASTIQQSDFNKQSLEIMWKLRHIVKMKLWNSWEYKYVAIVDVDITKEGTEDGVYEATLTLQEVPIVAMHSEQETMRTQKVAYSRKNPMLKANGELAIRLLDFAGGESSIWHLAGVE